MKKRLNNKGFTLIELLVTMTILAIITAMAVPLLRNVTTNGTSRKFSTFKDNIVYASKLYVDSYEEDLFDNRDSGCAYIDVETLIDKKLAKDINIDNTSCITKESFVQVIKTEKKYSYIPYITCGKINEDGTVSNNSYTYPEGKHVKDDTICGIDAEFNMSINPTVDQTEESAKKITLKIDAKSYTGFNQNIVMYYGFTSSSTSTVPDGSWQRVSFANVPSSKEQKNMIQAGSPNGIELLSEPFYTPDSYNGSLYLIIKIDNLIDLYGDSWKKQGNAILTYGPYRIDNSAPVIEDITLKKENGVWSFDSFITDDTNFEEYIGICPKAEFVTSCSDKSEYTQNYNTANTIDESNVYHNGGSGSGFNMICIKATDYAGNFSEQTCSNTMKYNVRMYYNDGTNDYETRELYFNNRSEKKKYSELTTAGPSRTKSGYNFKHWSTTANDSSGAIDPDEYFTGDYDKLYAIWDVATYTITMKNTNNNNKTETTTYNVLTSKTLPNMDNVPGYTFTGWTGSGLTTPTRNYTLPRGSSGDKTYTANFYANQYTITLTGLGGPNQTITYHTDDIVRIPNPTREGFYFQGWTWTGQTTPIQPVHFQRGTHENKTLTAHWLLAG